MGAAHSCICLINDQLLYETLSFYLYALFNEKALQKKCVEESVTCILLSFLLVRCDINIDMLCSIVLIFPLDIFLLTNNSL